MNTDTQPLIDLYEQMIATKTSYIHKILEFKKQGVNIGAPTTDDIVEREQGSIDALKRSIEFMRSN